MQVIKLLRTAGYVASIAALGREFKVKDDIVQCTPEEIDAILPELTKMGLPHLVIDDGQPAPVKAEPLKPDAQVSGSVEAKALKGKWGIYDGDVLISPLAGKAEADAFNALTVEEKANRVAELRAAKE